MKNIETSGFRFSNCQIIPSGTIGEVIVGQKADYPLKLRNQIILGNLLRAAFPNNNERPSLSDG